MYEWMQRNSNREIAKETQRDRGRSRENEWSCNNKHKAQPERVRQEKHNSAEADERPKKKLERGSHTESERASHTEAKQRRKRAAFMIHANSTLVDYIVHTLCLMTIFTSDIERFRFQTRYPHEVVKTDTSKTRGRLEQVAASWRQVAFLDLQVAFRKSLGDRLFARSPVLHWSPLSVYAHGMLS